MKHLLPLLVLAGVSCTKIGPDYQEPTIDVAKTYKTVGLNKPPSTGKWWASFSDKTLNTLLSRSEKNNPDARAALARLDQARATLGMQTTDKFPGVSAGILAERKQESNSDRFESPGAPFNRYEPTLNLSYEIDFWGRVRRSIAQQQALADASQADYATAILSTKAEVTRNYITLRFLDSEISLLRKTLSLREQNLALIQARIRAGDTTSIDSARAKTLTETVRADIHRLQKRRDELENAIAVLVGTTPSSFNLSSSTPPKTPRIPSGIPSDLLRRRSDVAASERRLAAASEAIGITIANYYPRVDLNASAGVAALSTADLFEKSSRIWTIGPELNIPLFPGGRRKNDTARAKAAYLEALELYRKAVLSAFQDVENALSGIHNLDLWHPQPRSSISCPEKIHRCQPRSCSPYPTPLQSRSGKLL